MRFHFVIKIAAALALFAASTDATGLNKEQVKVARRFLASLDPSLAIASSLQQQGIDTDALASCYEGLHKQGITMATKENRVTITKQCIFSIGNNNIVDNAKGKGRDPRAIPIDKFSKLTLSGAPNPDLCVRNTKLQKHDGTQQPNRCAAVDLGEIPSADKCPSQLFLTPKNGATLKAKKPINFKVVINNLDTGFFSDPAIEYYKFPQMLNKKGFIMGHSHITVQEIGNGKRPPSPQSFTTFEGLNNPAQNNIFTLNVPGGLAAGNYRACTLSGSFAHTPVLCPVAKRGAQDDCIRFKVV